jgi:ElaB/YqjD/DUF883 family membrane-anchored ribosome-binding protein
MTQQDKLHGDVFESGRSAKDMNTLDASREILHEQFSEYYEKLKDTPQFQAAKKAKENVVEYIEANPVQSSLIALGIGVALGMLFGRRR